MRDHSRFTIDFIGIGAEKCGTTWVADRLKSHPEVCLSEPKEIHYFNKKTSYIHGRLNKNYKKSFAWYKKHFSHCSRDKKIGEFSTFYLYDRRAPKLIKQKFPGVKLIVCLRDPIDRAYSQYQMYKNYFKKENRKFEDVIKEEPEYLEKGLYYKQLKHYLKYFKKSQILILFLEDIKEKPKEQIKKLYEHLELSDTSFVPSESNNRSNPPKSIKSNFVIEMMKLVSNTLIFFNLTKLLHFLKQVGVKRKLVSLFSQSYDYDPINPSTRKQLLPFFEDDIRRLEKLLNKDLSSWKK